MDLNKENYLLLMKNMSQYFCLLGTHTLEFTTEEMQETVSTYNKLVEKIAELNKVHKRIDDLYKRDVKDMSAFDKSIDLAYEIMDIQNPIFENLIDKITQLSTRRERARTHLTNELDNEPREFFDFLVSKGLDLYTVLDSDSQDIALLKDEYIKYKENSCS